ncbi:MAG: hypothetical protein PVG30_03475 [Gammaproteobacteria bacterium]|jgi:hypothetical protein
MITGITVGILKYCVPPLIIGLMGWGGGWLAAKRRYKGEVYGILLKDKRQARLELNDCLYDIKSYYQLVKEEYELDYIFCDSKNLAVSFLKRLENDFNEKADRYRVSHKKLSKLMNTKRMFYTSFVIGASDTILLFIKNKFKFIFYENYREHSFHGNYVFVHPDTVASILTEQIKLIDKVLNRDFVEDLIELKASKKTRRGL